LAETGCTDRRATTIAIAETEAAASRLAGDIRRFRVEVETARA
jgi:hypothetical protein